MAIRAISSLKPVHPQRELHGVNPRIRHGQPCIGDVLITRAECERASFAVEELKTESAVGQEICPRSIGRDHVVSEKNAATKLEKWDRAVGVDEIPFQVDRVECRAVS